MSRPGYRSPNRLHTQRRYDWKRRYGITPEDYERMAKEQNNCCAICSQPVENLTKRDKLCIDHDHKTGKVRGLLCGGCNAHLAVLENIDFIIKAQSYLDRYRK